MPAVGILLFLLIMPAAGAMRPSELPTSASDHANGAVSFDSGARPVSELPDAASEKAEAVVPLGGGREAANATGRGHDHHHAHGRAHGHDHDHADVIEDNSTSPPASDGASNITTVVDPGDGDQTSTLPSGDHANDTEAVPADDSNSGAAAGATSVASTSSGNGSNLLSSVPRPSQAGAHAVLPETPAEPRGIGRASPRAPDFDSLRDGGQASGSAKQSSSFQDGDGAPDADKQAEHTVGIAVGLVGMLTVIAIGFAGRLAWVRASS